MEFWLPTRYAAAYFEINKKTCHDYIDLVITNTTQANNMCVAFPFENINNLYTWVASQKADWVKAQLIEFTNITNEEYDAIYNPADTNSLGYRLN